MELISGPEFSGYPEARLVKIEALDALGHLDELIEILDQPRNMDEGIRLISLLLQDGRTDEASGKLGALSDLFDRATFSSLTEKIVVQRIMS